ncbi:hypothetical protein ONZ45_g11483 [Pleurotus djamor]|nr:hypothetical protein ONZ45_g11483 [Pleurotus djamor]
MDFIVKLPLSHNYDSILVVCDRFTRAAHFIPCSETITSPDLAWLFLDRIFRYHGLPSSIISDRGSVFVSKFFTAFCNLVGIKIKSSSAYHPQTDGLTERTNQTLETYLRAYCSYQQDDWVDYLPLAEFAFNNLINSSTNTTPFFANYAFHPKFEPKLSELHTVPAADDLANRLAHIHAELRAELEHAQSQQAFYYNQGRLPAPDFKPDQLVWLLRRNIKTTRPSDKLDHRRLGPYPILSKVHQSAYLLDLPRNLSRLYPVFNVSLLEPYKDPSLFHTHADPEPFTLAETPLSIDSFLECRKIGHRYEYLVRWKDQPDSEDSWVPLSDIPTSLNEALDRFHRRHPHFPHPHYSALNLTYDPRTLLTELSARTYDPDYELTSDLSLTGPDTSIPLAAAAAPRPALPVPPPRPARPASPPVVRQRLRSEYVPPPQTTTRLGRVSRPPTRYDPEL